MSEIRPPEQPETETRRGRGRRRGGVLDRSLQRAHPAAGHVRRDGARDRRWSSCARSRSFRRRAPSPTRRSGPPTFPTVFAKEEALVGSCAGGAQRARPRWSFPVPAPPFTEGIFPCMTVPRRHSAQSGAARARGHAQRHRAAPRRGASLVSRLPRHEQPRPAAPRERRARCRSPSRTGCAANATARSTATGASGIHGKRTGYWNGSKRYLLCVHCHNPHSPRFAALQPLPPPVRPQFLRPADAAVAAAAANRSAAPRRQEGGDAAHAR